MANSFKKIGIGVVSLVSTMKSLSMIKLIPAVVIAMAALGPMSAQADTLIGTFDTGRIFNSGGCFDRTFNRGIGRGFRTANVQLAGWDLTYRSKDHHITRATVRISNVDYRSSTGNVSFRVTGCYHDKNRDDDFDWQVWYTVLGQS